MITKFKIYEEYSSDVKIDITNISIEKLRELLIGKVVSFKGQDNNKLSYEYVVKAKIKDVNGLFMSENDKQTYIHEFVINNGDMYHYYRVDNDTPVIIHELESNVNKYNL